jgi:hypothetical protein
MIVSIGNEGSGAVQGGGGVLNTYWPTTRYRPSGESARLENARAQKSCGEAWSGIGDCRDPLAIEITSIRFAVKLAA